MRQNMKKSWGENYRLQTFLCSGCELWLNPENQKPSSAAGSHTAFVPSVRGEERNFRGETPPTHPPACLHAWCFCRCGNTEVMWLQQRNFQLRHFDSVTSWNDGRDMCWCLSCRSIWTVKSTRCFKSQNCWYTVLCVLCTCIVFSNCSCL